MPAATPTVTTYIDIVSAYAYAAHHVLTTHPLFSSTTLIVKPIFLGGVMGATGNRPPLAVPAKGKYTTHDFRRQCGRLDIPLRVGSQPMPAGFPINTILMQRALVVLQTRMGDGEAWRRVLGGVLDAFWVRHDKVTEEADVRRVLEAAGVGEEEVERVITDAQGPIGKEGLKRNTDEALQEGCFGLPWFVVEDGTGNKDVFWGLDHLAQVAEMVGVEWTEREHAREVREKRGRTGANL